MNEDTAIRLSDIVTSLLESLINWYLIAITLVGNFFGLDMDNFSSVLIVSTGILFALMALSSIFHKTFKFLFSIGCALILIEICRKFFGF